MPDLELTQCDREPVHFVGAIQPFGSLFALDSACNITHRSANLDLVAAEQRSSTLHDLLDPVSRERLLAAILSNSADGPLPALILAIGGAVRRVLPHRHAGRVLVEVEDVTEEPVQALTRYHELVSTFASALEGLDDPLSVCVAAARTVRELTGYERVMVYHFHADLHGEVIAEDRALELDSWLGLHYPATDIPAPARAIFCANKLRMIPNVDYSPVPIIPAHTGLGELDLTRSLLRSVSPIHLEYLRNMQVRGSLTLSIKKADRLWGLIACHHTREPKYVSFALRNACAILADYVGAAVALKADQRDLVHRRRAAQAEAALRTPIESFDSLAEALTRGPVSVRDLVAEDATGVTIARGEEITTCGNTPSIEEARALMAWLVQSGKPSIYNTDHLEAEYPPAAAYTDRASGILAALVSRDPLLCVLWCKPERVQTVRWGGDPGKSTFVDGMRLHPRKSFAAWAETVRGRSSPWQPWEIDSASSFLLVLTARELRRSLASERVARAEAERANRTKDEFIAVISHDLRDPLSSIHLNLAVMQKVIPAPSLGAAQPILASMERASLQMQRLVKGLLDIAAIEAGRFTLDRSRFVAGDLLREVTEVLEPIARQKRIDIRVSVPKEPTEVLGSRDHLLQVCSNVLANAIKFTPDAGSVEARVFRDNGATVFEIADSGPGIPPEDVPYIFDRFWRARGTRSHGIGLGLSIAKGIIEAHGGTIEVQSILGRGTVFRFRIPDAQ